jgi:cell division protein ZapE
MTEGPLFAYRALRRSGALTPDPVQELVAEKLQSLHHALHGHVPARGITGWKERFGLSRRREAPPQGLYIYGGVGRGKSMLMDLLFDTAPVERKRRVHFHAFMVEVHDAIHQWRQQSSNKRSGDPIAPVAVSLADSAWLLCFDEFHVTDIADAMILGRLFEALFAHGVVIVATSNWPPDDLYQGGLQRELFMPFIALINEKLDLLGLSGPTDYRLARLKTMRVYTVPLGPDATDVLEEDFSQLTEGAAIEPDRIEVKGRTLDVSRTARGVAWMRFEELCEQPLGAEDYLAVARRYHTLILDGVPVMDAAKRNEAKRFMTLIDALYEAKVHLIVAADAPPDQIYAVGSHGFEFQRTASRLIEMQSPGYIETPHRYGMAEAIP